MNKRTLRNILLIITMICVFSGIVCDAAKATEKVIKEAKVAVVDAKVATVDAKKAVIDAKKAVVDAKNATQDAKDAAKDAQKVAKELAKDAEKAITKAKVINISLFATTNVSKEKEKKKEEKISVIDTKDFKVDGFRDLLLHIQKWWSDILTWFSDHQTNILVLFVGLLFTFAIVALLGWFFNKVVIEHITKHTASRWDDKICKTIRRPLSFLIFTVGVFISSLGLLNDLEEDTFSVILRTFLALMALSVTWAIYRLVEVFNNFLKELAQRSDNNLDDLLVDLIRKAIRMTIVFIAVIFIGQTILGWNITALIAGAGIVGLAVALAAKDTLANFFGSVMIMLDKPFVVGERVTIDSLTGVVERIGFRTTRIRSLSGHMYSMPNSKIADSVVENVTKRPYIKYAFDLTLVYDTTAVQMDRAMEILHEILDKHEGFNKEMPSRIYFTSFNDWALNISVIVWFQCTDYFQTQQWKNDINLEILRRFNAEGLDFAFPTSTNHLVGDDVDKELKITTVEELKK
jgi:MscS family membrane protein